MVKEQNSDKSCTARDAEFEIFLSSEDINKIEEKIRNKDDAETQNSNLANGVVLINICTDCGIMLFFGTNMIYKTLCGFRIGKKQNAPEMDV